MMNVVSIGFLTMKVRKKANIILTILTSLLFLSISVMLAGVKNSTVRYEPFENIFNKQGAFVSYFGTEEIDSYLADLGIPDGYDTMCFYESSGSTDNGTAVNVIVCSDEYLKALNLPVKYQTVNSKDCICVYMPDNDSISIGEKFSISSIFPGKTFKVTKIYSDFTYEPTMLRYNKYELDYSLFYKTYDKDDKNSNLPFILISDADIPNISEIIPAFGFFVYYPNEISSQGYYEFIENLPEGGFTEFSVLNENSELKQKNNLLKYVPIALTFAITIIFGLLCCIAVLTSQDLKRMGVFAISGMNRRDCLLIYSVNFGTVLLASVVVNLIILNIMLSCGINAKLGLVYSTANVILTIVLIAIFTAACIFIPVKIIYSKKPQELLREL